MQHLWIENEGVYKGVFVGIIFGIYVGHIGIGIVIYRYQVI